MKVRSLDQFSQSITDCLSWRKHELKNLQSFFNKEKEPVVALTKGALLLTYAHWEGGIKDVAYIYLRHVESQSLFRDKLKSNFLALESISAIKQAAASNQILPYQQAIEHVRYNAEHRYRLPNIQLIDTESNLSSRVLKNILACIGLLQEWEHFAHKQRVIDFALLKNRNDVAHTGQTEDRKEVDVYELVGHVLELLEIFKNVVENAAVQRCYLEPQA
jgi:hypothetical protein